jgi:predicted permease
LRGLAEARGIDPGFRSDGIVNVPVDLSLRTYDRARGSVYFAEALAAVRALDGVVAASLIGTPPLSGSNSGTSVLPATAAVGDREASRGTTFTPVADGYFELVSLPLLAGRSFEPGDREGAPRVAIVNESFARMFWAEGAAIGERFRIAGEDDLTTVVGLTRDTKYKSLNDAGEPFMYLPITQHFQSAAVIQARLRSDTPAARLALQAAVQAVDPSLAIAVPRSMADAMRVSLLPARVGAIFLGAFGSLALLLATIGVYGVTSYVVGRRTNEVGIRTALGAPSMAVLRLLMSETLRVVLVGSAAGVAGGVLIGTVASSQLYGVRAFDPAAILGASGVLVFTAVIGTWIPARRALRGDPVAALRAD